MAQDTAILVDHVSKEFKLPHEKQTSIKGALISLMRRGTKRSFERQRVLQDVSFEIKKGEFFGVVGRNGSGKSTMLKMLAGIYMPTSGGIHVNGKITPFIELGVGFNPELTGRENVFLNGALLGFSRADMYAMYDDIVKFAELEKFMDQKLKNYSSGMQVRLAFSIAIRAQGDILILDEVLAVGDAAFQQKCYDYFENLKNSNTTVVFVSHDMGAVRRFCTQAVYIREGKLIKQGTPAEIAEVYLQDNIETVTGKDQPNFSSKYRVDGTLDVTSKSARLNIDYSAGTSEQTYVGMSISRDGISVAELTTDLKRPLKGEGELSLTINTTVFNPGVYAVTVALFKLENRELLAIGNQQTTFTVHGDDIRRGASLKLEDTWVYG